MWRLLINYICKDCTGFDDGGSIYDFKIIESLKKLVSEVNVIFVPPKRGCCPPLWLFRFSSADVVDVASKIKPGKTIVSHESLANLLKSISCDLYLLHNDFSHFKFFSRPEIQFYYRFFSSGVYKSIYRSSVSVSFISAREMRLNLSAYPDLSSVSHIFPPGPPPVSFLPLGFDLASIRMQGSSNWLPKKVCALNERDLELLVSSGFEIVENDHPQRCVSLITDKFLSGFKLKLIESLVLGDIIFSFVDIREELESLGLTSSGVYIVKSLNEMIDILGSGSIVEAELLGDMEVRSRKIQHEYSWQASCDKLVSRLSA